MHVNTLKNLFLSIQDNIIGRAQITRFSQVAHDPEIKKYFLRGAEIYAKQIKIYSTFLSDEDIPIHSDCSQKCFFSPSLFIAGGKC
jgi:hypothetical protein